MTRVKIFVYLTLALLLTSFTLGCVGEKGPKAEGKALYDYITKDNNYKKWNMWPGKTELYPGKEPHGAFLTTYVSDNAFSAINGKKGSMPEDAIIVKENYDADKKLVALTVMYKEENYDPDHNNWFWAKYQPDGTIDAEGKVAACYNCHEKAEDNDYIFTGNLK